MTEPLEPHFHAGGNTEDLPPIHPGPHIKPLGYYPSDSGPVAPVSWWQRLLAKLRSGETTQEQGDNV